MMEEAHLISAHEFCIKHNIEISFVNDLQRYGLIEINAVDDDLLIDSLELVKLEKFVRLYFELDINLEGIETITHLLSRIEHMQREIDRLENRLRFYEGKG